MSDHDDTRSAPDSDRNPRFAAIDADTAATATSQTTETDALPPWFSLVDALADDAVQWMWEQGTPATALPPLPTPQAPSRRRGRAS